MVPLAALLQLVDYCPSPQLLESLPYQTKFNQQKLSHQVQPSPPAKIFLQTSLFPHPFFLIPLKGL